VPRDVRHVARHVVFSEYHSAVRRDPLQRQLVLPDECDRALHSYRVAVRQAAGQVVRTSRRICDDDDVSYRRVDAAARRAHQAALVLPGVVERHSLQRQRMISAARPRSAVMAENVDAVSGLADRRELPCHFQSFVAAAVERDVLVVNADYVDRTANNGAFNHCRDENSEHRRNKAPHAGDNVSLFLFSLHDVSSST